MGLENSTVTGSPPSCASWVLPAAGSGSDLPWTRVLPGSAEVFIKLYERGLIYRDYYITNWCPKCHTTISDIEVEHLSAPGTSTPSDILIKTAREIVIIRPPETIWVMLQAVTGDERYAVVVGKSWCCPWGTGDASHYR